MNVPVREAASAGARRGSPGAVCRCMSMWIKSESDRVVNPPPPPPAPARPAKPSRKGRRHGRPLLPDPQAALLWATGSILKLNLKVRSRSIRVLVAAVSRCAGMPRRASTTE
jgi:hypothetical protein